MASYIGRRELLSPARPRPTRSRAGILARRIIEVARRGECDPDELCARALQALGFGKRQNRVNGRFPFSPRLRVS
jgi:hypothetical protein